MGVIGVQISDLTSSNRQAAYNFITSHLLMMPDDIEKALAIPGFIFYSNLFASTVLTGYPFTVTPVNVTEDIYINIAGGRLEVPIAVANGEYTTKTLEAGEYILLSEITESVEINEILATYVRTRHLFYLSVNFTTGTDFNDDFDVINDFN